MGSDGKGAKTGEDRAILLSSHPPPSAEYRARRTIRVCAPPYPETARIPRELASVAGLVRSERAVRELWNHSVAKGALPAFREWNLHQISIRGRRGVPGSLGGGQDDLCVVGVISFCQLAGYIIDWEIVEDNGRLIRPSSSR